MVMKRHFIPQKPLKKVSDPEIGVFTRKEIALIIIFIIIASFISFVPKISTNIIEILLIILILTIIIFVNITVKKLTAPYYAIKIEHRIWEFQRWGYYKRSYFKKPLPFGLILPFFLAVLSLGYLKPFTFFQYDAENLPEKRLLKYSGQRRPERKEMINEEDLAYTTASGFYALLFIALVGLILNSFLNNILNFDFGFKLAKFSIYYSLWNMIPFSQLDGSKLFFGATVAWIFILILQLIFLLVIVF